MRVRESFEDDSDFRYFEKRAKLQHRRARTEDERERRQTKHKQRERSLFRRRDYDEV